MTFPVLSTIQNEDGRLARNYRKILRLSAFLIFPMMLMLSAIADPLVRYLEQMKDLLPIFGVSLVMWLVIHVSLWLTSNLYIQLPLGIAFFDDMPGVKHNYAYFPIFVDAEKYGMTRDELYEKMKAAKVWGRRYFYPLISEFSTYRGLESAAPENLPNAHKMADSVICLPMHHALSDEDIQRTLECIVK